MPPKAKFTKEDIVKKALDIVRENGIEAVTARELGARLQSSARPIFTVFQNMEEVQEEVINSAKKLFNEYTKEFESYTPAFKRFGMQWISFAMNEPKLFQLLFMQRKDKNYALDDISLGHDIMSNPEALVETLKKDYELNDNQATKLYDQMWVHTYGICVLCATGMCTFSQQEMAQMLGEVFAGLMMLLKAPATKKMEILPDGYNVGNMTYMQGENKN